MMVVKQLATQFEIQLAIELCDTFTDMLGLNLEVFLVVKSYFDNALFTFSAAKV